MGLVLVAGTVGAPHLQHFTWLAWSSSHCCANCQGLKAPCFSREQPVADRSCLAGLCRRGYTSPPPQFKSNSQSRPEQSRVEQADLLAPRMLITQQDSQWAPTLSGFVLCLPCLPGSFSGLFSTRLLLVKICTVPQLLLYSWKSDPKAICNEWEY